MKRFCLALVLAAACGGKAPATSQTSSAMPTATPANATAGDPSCPLEVPGTSLTVEDTAGGAALVFVTTGDAAELSKRANAFAEMHNKHDGPADAMGMMFPQTWKAKAVDIEGGARVELEPAKPEDAGALQSELRMHAHHLTGGSCKM
ncbi:MAG: hypothetical protein HOV81_28625 [Kofleriaceae bacterium]|nr:hypothetical protein [Kofleriaceae bacterium]